MYVQLHVDVTVPTNLQNTGVAVDSLKCLGSPFRGLSKWKNGLTETLWIPAKVSIGSSSWDGIALCSNTTWHWLPRKQLCRSRARTPELYECDIKFCTIRVMKANSILCCLGGGVASRQISSPHLLRGTCEAIAGALVQVQGSMVGERRDISKLSWAQCRVTKMIRRLSVLTLWVCSAWRRECSLGCCPQLIVFVEEESSDTSQACSVKGWEVMVTSRSKESFDLVDATEWGGRFRNRSV